VEEGEALLHDHAAPGHQVARLLEGHLRVCAFEGGGGRVSEILSKSVLPSGQTIQSIDWRTL
jgi:hypothetical protein